MHDTQITLFKIFQAYQNPCTHNLVFDCNLTVINIVAFHDNNELWILRTKMGNTLKLWNLLLFKYKENYILLTILWIQKTTLKHLYLIATHKGRLLFALIILLCWQHIYIVPVTPIYEIEKWCAKRYFNIKFHFPYYWDLHGGWQ